MRLHALILFLSLHLVPAYAILADEAFQVDYHQALLGLPQDHTTFFHKPQSSSNATLLYALSRRNVVGAINPKDGTLLWRQSLSDVLDTIGIETSFLTAAEGAGIVVAGAGRTVAAFDALDGRSVWQHVGLPGTRVTGAQAVSQLGSSGSDVVVAFTNKASTTVYKYDVDTGAKKWQWTDDSGSASFGLAVSSNSVFHIGGSKITVLDAATGKQGKQQSSGLSGLTSTASDINIGSCPCLPYLAYRSDLGVSSSVTITFTHLPTMKSSSLTFDLATRGELASISIEAPCASNVQPHFLVQLRTKTKHWAEVFHVDVKSGAASKAYTLPATEEQGTFSASNVDAAAYFVRATESEVLLYSSASHGVLGRWPRVWTTHGQPLFTKAEVAARGKAGFALRVVETSSIGELSLIRNGEQVWARPEYLAHITNAEWAEDPSEDSLARELEIEAHGNVVAAYVHRVRRHLAGLATLPKTLSSLPTSLLSSISGGSSSPTASLSGRKTIIATTDLNQVLALASDSGRVKWIEQAKPIVSAQPVKKSLILVEGDQTIVRLGESSLVLNISNGLPSGFAPQVRESLDSTVSVEGQSSTSLFTVDGKDGELKPLDSTAGIEGTIVAVDSKGFANGWIRAGKSSSLTKQWTLSPGFGFKYVSATTRPLHDPVASIGKVLGDRNVLYKYTSPNLVFLTAVSKDTLTVSIVEAVTGAILHVSLHKGVATDATIPVALSENWFVYSFFGASSTTNVKSHQLIVGELFESSIANDRISFRKTYNYSVYDPEYAKAPHVLSQAYTLSEPISHMAVTQTAQGITSRQLLCTLPDSNAIIGIPRHVLDPRRPIDRDPKGTELEEGLFRYQPVLELDPKWHLTHGRDVQGIQKIMTHPSALESTCFVFAYGLDVFGTRTSPSMAYDVLGKGFNKVALMATVLALAVGVAALAPIVQKRQINQRWKL